MAPKYKPFISIEPGEFIKEELEIRDWRQEDLARILGITPKHLNQIITSKKPITIQTAKLLSKAFGQSPQYWLNLHTNYQLSLGEETQAEAQAEKKAQIYEHMPIPEMVEKDWIAKWDKNKVDKLVSSVCQFWCMDQLDFSFMDKWTLPAFRKSDAFLKYNKYYAMTWHRMAEKCADLYKVPDFDKRQLRKLVANLYKYTSSENLVPRFLHDLNNVGVKFFVLPHLQNTYTDGAAFSHSGNPVVVWTARYNRIDNFWFTTAHELAHVVLHLDGRRQNELFIDSVEGSEGEKEEQANAFAENVIKANEIIMFFRKNNTHPSKRHVIKCSEELCISSAIVIGVLHHIGILPQTHLNQFIGKVVDYIPEHYFAEKQRGKAKLSA